MGQVIAAVVFFAGSVVVLAWAMRGIRRQSQDDAHRMSKSWMDREERRRRDGRP